MKKSYEANVYHTNVNLGINKKKTIFLSIFYGR